MNSIDSVYNIAFGLTQPPPSRRKLASAPAQKLSAQDCEEALPDLTLLENGPHRFFYCRPVFEFIAEKSNPF
jgi:hypothetical protein